MTNTSLKLRATIALFLGIIAPSSLQAATGEIVGTFEGSFPTGRQGETRFIEIMVSREDSKYELSGSAGFSSGRSTAPDFWGELVSTTESSFVFNFEDSFGNKGTMSLSPIQNGVRFSSNISEIADPRCLPHYEPVELKRTKN